MITKDKALHFALSAGMALIIYAMARDLILSTLVTLFAGALKEAIDVSQGSHGMKEAWLDLLFDVIGVGFVIGVVLASGV